MSRYHETIMIADFTCGHWKPVKQSKKLRKELADYKGTIEEAVKVGKNLFPFKVTPPAYKAVTSAFTRARDVHNEQTAPWNNDGGRALMASNHFNYTNLMRVCRRECETTWAAFKLALPELKEESRAISNGIFDEADWPDDRKLEKTFKFKIEFFPFPNVADWRCDVSELEMQAIRENSEDAVKEKLKQVAREPYRRLFKVIQHMVDRLRSDSDEIDPSVVDNIREQVVLIPSLNFLQDQTLTDLGEEIEASLLKFTGDQLSVKGHLRTTVAARAEEIVDEIESLGVAA